MSLITAQIEAWAERIEEMKAFFPTHAAELDTYHDRRPLDPVYEEYARRDAHGNVLLVTVRQDGKIVGYFIGFVQPALHYRQTLTCLMDIFYVLPEHRTGRPTAALKMFRCVIAECKRRGVKEIRVGSKTAHDASRLFEFLGFTEVERIYSMWIGPDHA